MIKKKCRRRIPETPTPLESANAGNGDTQDTPPPLENADGPLLKTCWVKLDL